MSLLRGFGGAGSAGETAALLAAVQPQGAEGPTTLRQAWAMARPAGAPAAARPAVRPRVLDALPEGVDIDVASFPLHRGGRSCLWGGGRAVSPWPSPSPTTRSRTRPQRSIVRSSTLRFDAARDRRRSLVRPTQDPTDARSLWAARPLLAAANPPRQGIPPRENKATPPGPVSSATVPSATGVDVNVARRRALVGAGGGGSHPP